ncbi:MAG: hypothetical protein DMG30_04620 [Acidobacteria bacterium]|nr:MAG: hypothetical protein DMG30_04620 [Acidobacteriota bacterium]
MVGEVVNFGNWLQNTSWALAIATSDWAYPFVQATHFTGLSLWIGTSVAVDLSLLGVGNRRQPPSRLSDALFLWNWIGFAIAIAGGFLLFSVSAATYLVNAAFLTKLGLLIPLAVILHVAVQKRVRGWGQMPAMPAVAKLAGLAELLLWLSVATAAVSIPYLA